MRHSPSQSDSPCSSGSGRGGGGIQWHCTRRVRPQRLQVLTPPLTRETPAPEARHRAVSSSSVSPRFPHFSFFLFPGSSLSCALSWCRRRRACVSRRMGYTACRRHAQAAYRYRASTDISRKRNSYVLIFCFSSFVSPTRSTHGGNGARTHRRHRPTRGSRDFHSSLLWAAWVGDERSFPEPSEGGDCPFPGAILERFGCHTPPAFAPLARIGTFCVCRGESDFCHSSSRVHGARSYKHGTLPPHPLALLKVGTGAPLAKMGWSDVTSASVMSNE
ncbi:hypothetical protein B0H15DRAFT_135888 [Mycena belliarum]|uniref:Uncharacterized protein n=1 Tax=Mycena belliarum TaxID=1033014 RepID=A0AAD6UDQ8_9AGAR|nr:hypothetical protein B0H15DRAFT_135888 [Mycena belliae]